MLVEFENLMDVFLCADTQMHGTSVSHKWKQRDQGRDWDQAGDCIVFVCVYRLPNF